MQQGLLTLSFYGGSFDHKNFLFLDVFAASGIEIVDNTMNKNIIAELHGYCTGPDFRYDVYWDDPSGSATDIQVVLGGTVQQTVGRDGFYTGTDASLQPATYIRRNNSATAPFTIQARDAADATNISTSVTVVPKDCLVHEIDEQDDYTSSNASVYTVPATDVTHVRASAIGGGGNGSKKPGNDKVTSGGGGGAAAITVAEVTAGDVFSVTVGAGRSGAAGSIGRGGTSNVTNTTTATTIVSAQGGAGRGQGYEGWNAGGSTGIAHVIASGVGTSNATGGRAGRLSLLGYDDALAGGNGGSGGAGTGGIYGGGGLWSGQKNRNGGNGRAGVTRIEMYDTEVVLPTLTLEQSGSQVDPALSGSTVYFTATFSEQITVASLACNDLVISGTANAICVAVVESAPNDGTTFQIEIDTTTAGTVTIDIPEAAVHDIAGNNNIASTSSDNTVTLDVNTPTIIGPTTGSTVNSPTPTTGTCTSLYADQKVQLTTQPAGGLDPEPTILDLDSNGDWDDVFVWDPSTYGKTYDLLANCLDGGGNPGPLIVVESLTIGDGDGLSNSEEDKGNNNGDGNGDGILDSQQPFVSSKLSSVSGNPVTLESNGSTCRLITGYDILSESANATQDQDFDYPVGLMDFALSCSNIGESATIVFYFDKEYDVTDWQWRKYDRTTNQYTTIQSAVVYDVKTVGSEQVTTATYSLTDGANLDDDGTANAVIIDPAGPAVSTQEELELTPEPTPEPETPVEEPASCSDGSIGNRIWHDLNENGKIDDGEPGIEDVSIKLKNEKGETVDKDKTNRYGKYDFTKLSEGEYKIVVDEDDIEHYIQTYDPNGSVMNNVARTNLGCNEDVNDVDFGFIQKTGQVEKPKILAKTGGVSWW